MKIPDFNFSFLIIIPILFCGSVEVQQIISCKENQASDSTQQTKKVSVLRSQKNEAFKRGEKLTYRMHYGFINAGEVTMSVIDENKKLGGRNTFHVVGIGNTNSSFDLFFRVRDRYESYIDEDAIIPWLFIRRVDEGGYKINQNQIFYHYQNTMDMGGIFFDVPDNVQDMPSAFFMKLLLYLLIPL